MYNEHGFHFEATLEIGFIVKAAHQSKHSNHARHFFGTWEAASIIGAAELTLRSYTRRRLDAIDRLVVAHTELAIGVLCCNWLTPSALLLETDTVAFTFAMTFLAKIFCE